MLLRAQGLQAGYELGTEIDAGSEAQAAAITQTLATVPPFVPADAGTQTGKLQTGNGWSWIPAGACPAKAGAGMNGVYAQLRPIHPFIPQKAFD